MRATAVPALWSTSIGKKAVMAVSGLVLVGFVVVHMLGNLKVFQGQAKFDLYAHWLREVGAPVFGPGQLLWLARLVLLAAAVLHVVAAVELTRISRVARPIAYARRRPIASTYASRTMRWGGALLALFVVYHLLHFTFGAVGFGPGQFQPLSAYRNVVAGFSVWYVSAFYIAAMGALGLHMYHGVWSMFQTLGLNSDRSDSLYRALATVVSLAVVLGNVSVPVAVLTGLVR